MITYTRPLMGHPPQSQPELEYILLTERPGFLHVMPLIQRVDILEKFHTVLHSVGVDKGPVHTRALLDLEVTKRRAERGLASLWN